MFWLAFLPASPGTFPLFSEFHRQAAVLVLVLRFPLGIPRVQTYTGSTERQYRDNQRQTLNGSQDQQAPECAHTCRRIHCARHLIVWKALLHSYHVTAVGGMGFP